VTDPLPSVPADPAADAEPLEGILEEAEPQQLVRTIRAVLEQHSGPLPHPSILAEYKKVDEVCVSWILRQARQEQEQVRDSRSPAPHEEASSSPPPD
jgi:hypothetical protein